MKKLLSLFLAAVLLTGCAETYDGPTVSKSVCISAEMEVYNPDGSLSQTYREEYAYDIYGNRSRINEFYNNEPHLKSVLHYDGSGNVLRHIQYDLSGWLSKKILDVRYTYDDLGRQTSTCHRHGLSWDNDTTVYDDEAMTRTYTGANGTAIDYLNAYGWVMRTEQTFPDGRTVLTEYNRRSDGNLLTTRTYEDDVLISECICTYDDQGRLLTQTEIADGISTLLYSFEYGEDYEKYTDFKGFLTVIQYNPDGSMDYQVHYDESGRLSSMTRYRYTEIQVPAEEVSP